MFFFFYDFGLVPDIGLLLIQARDFHVLFYKINISVVSPFLRLQRSSVILIIIVLNREFNLLTNPLSQLFCVYDHG